MQYGVETNIPSEDILAALKENEDGDARLFITAERNAYCFDHSVEKWFKWSENHWEEDSLGDVVAEMDLVTRIYGDEVVHQAILRTEPPEMEEKKRSRRQSNLREIY